MTKYLTLTKLLFLQQFKTRFGIDKKKRRGTIALYVVLILCFAPTVVTVAAMMYFAGKFTHGNADFGTFLILLCQGLVLMFGIHAIISNVFVVKDAEKLLYLPVRAYVIFLAKLTVAYLNELITTAVTVLVVLLPFGMGASAGVGYYFMLMVSVVLIPMLPMLLSTLIAMPIAALVNLFGKNSYTKTVLRILLYVAIMAVYMYGMYRLGFLTGSENGSALDNTEEYVQYMLGDFTDKLNGAMPYFHPDYMLMNSMLAPTFTTFLLSFLAALGENVALLALVFAVSLPFYRRMLTLSIEEGSSRHKKGKENFDTKNIGTIRQFMLTDIKKTARDSQLGFQSFAGIIMMPLIVVVLYFFVGIADDGDSSLLQLITISTRYQVIAPLVILAYMTFIGSSTNILGLYPISRENRAIYILKSLPVSFNKILLAKVLLATAVMAACDFITCLLIVFLFEIEWYLGLAMFATMVFLGFGSMCITTLLDLKEPRLGWDNFNQGLKGVKNSWIAMLISFLTVVTIAAISVPFIILFVAFDKWYIMLLMWLLILGIAAGYSVVGYKIMTAKATKYFERIEV